MDEVLAAGNRTGSAMEGYLHECAIGKLSIGVNESIDEQLKL